MASRPFRLFTRAGCVAGHLPLDLAGTFGSSEKAIERGRELLAGPSRMGMAEANARVIGPDGEVWNGVRKGYESTVHRPNAEVVHPAEPSRVVEGRTTPA